MNIEEFESVKEWIKFYGEYAAKMHSKFIVASLRLNRIVELHDKFREEKNYEVSDAIRKALCIGPGVHAVGAEEEYNKRFDRAGGWFIPVLKK